MKTLEMGRLGLSKLFTLEPSPLYTLSTPPALLIGSVQQLILDEVFLRGDITLDVEGNGNGACLFDGGNKLKLPLSLTKLDTPTCKIDRTSKLATLLRQTRVIIWDECTLMDHCGYAALDRTL